MRVLSMIATDRICEQIHKARLAGKSEQGRMRAQVLCAKRWRRARSGGVVRDACNTGSLTAPCCQREMLHAPKRRVAKVIRQQLQISPRILRQSQRPLCTEDKSLRANRSKQLRE